MDIEKISSLINDKTLKLTKVIPLKRDILDTLQDGMEEIELM